MQGPLFTRALDIIDATSTKCRVSAPSQRPDDGANSSHFSVSATFTTTDRSGHVESDIAWTGASFRRPNVASDGGNERSSPQTR